MEIFNRFKLKFNRNDSLVRASELDLVNLKNELQIEIPEDYKLFLMVIGNVWSPDLLDIIVDNELELSDVQQFWTINEIINDKKKEWTAQLSIDLIPFASDCMGNIFGFLVEDLKEPKKSCPVYFFDHDFDTVEKISSSFLNWIDTFNRI